MSRKQETTVTHPKLHDKGLHAAYGMVLFG